MKKRTFLQIVSVCVLFVALFFTNLTQGFSQSPYSSQEMLIKFEPGIGNAYINSFRSSLGATEIAVSPLSGVRLWTISNFSEAMENHGWTNINETSNGSKDKAGVNSVGLNFESVTPSIGGGSSSNPAWNPLGSCTNYDILCNTANRPVKVAILDTGIGYTGSNNNPSFCNEDLFQPFYTSNIGYDFVNNDNQPQDDQGHGTHIAGIIAQIASTADNANIQLLSYKTHNSNGNGTLFNIIQAVDRAILDGAKIINMSFSYQAPAPSGKPDPLQTAINVAANYGVLVVAAAGNLGGSGGVGNTSPWFYPASFDCPNIISVASSNCNGNLSNFSAWGPTNVDIAMLGENILGPHHLNGSFIFKSGTSQSAAIVSGIATLMGTFLQDVNYGPLKCSILGAAEYKVGLDNLIVTEGIADAPDALALMLNGCVASSGADFTLAAAPPVQEEISAEEISVYPNPFSEEVSVNFKGIEGETASFAVFNALGGLLYTEKKTIEDTGHIAFSWQAGQCVLSGVYFIRIQTTGKTITQKVIKN